MTSRTPSCLILILAAMAAGCSKTADSPEGPSRGPKYPPHAPVSPSVATATFTTGPAYDWEDAAAKVPARFSVVNFANTRSFAETSRWIQQTLPQYLAPTSETHERMSDLHFRGCIMEWRIDSFSENHINEYNYSVNLGDVDLTNGRVRTGGLGNSVSLNWDGNKNPRLFRAWQKEDGEWKMQGERTENDAPGEFELQPRDHIADRLAYAFFHAARLCGSPVPTGNY
jgi:hypothetical protein